MINLSGVFNFFIILIELCVIGAMIFTAMDFIGTDERFKKIAKIAVGGVLVVLFLFAVRDVFGGGGAGGMNLTPGGFLMFAVAVILTLILWYVIDALLGWVAANWAPFLAPALDIIRFVLAGLMLVVILVAAANILLGVSLNGGGSFLGNQRHGALLSNDRKAARLVLPGHEEPSAPYPA